MVLSAGKVIFLSSHPVLATTYRVSCLTGTKVTGVTADSGIQSFAETVEESDSDEDAIIKVVRKRKRV